MWEFSFQNADRFSRGLSSQRMVDVPRRMFNGESVGCAPGWFAQDVSQRKNSFTVYDFYQISVSVLECGG
jgi:hypothetical protein